MFLGWDCGKAGVAMTKWVSHSSRPSARFHKDLSMQALRILKKLYKSCNASWQPPGVAVYSDEALSDKERAVLAEMNWQVNRLESFSGHAEVQDKLLALKDHPQLSRQRCLDAFVAGVGGSYLRGLSLLAAWHYLHSMPAHPYEARDCYLCCHLCGGSDKPEVQNDSDIQFALHLGGDWVSPQYIYLNLRYFLAQPDIVPSEQDKATFARLLDMLRNAAPDETPGQFEQRLHAAKLLKVDKYSRRGLLNSLARVGVIPNAVIDLSCEHWVGWLDIVKAGEELRNTKGRSDMEMPWAGWQGSLKVNEARLQALFAPWLLAA